jgi:hypothetical protein
MMARAPDNGCYTLISDGINRADGVWAEVKNVKDLITISDGERSGYNLRKTARGASSPAKPALHMPDLKEDDQSPSVE